DRHRDLELVSLRAAVTYLLPCSKLDAALVLERLAPQSGATQCPLSHENSTSRVVLLLDLSTLPSRDSFQPFGERPAQARGRAVSAASRIPRSVSTRSSSAAPITKKTM